MQILIVGSGGREYAIAKAIANNPKVKKIFLSPGNGGTFFLAQQVNCENVKLDYEQLLPFALENKIDLTIVGSEEYLVKGMVNSFQAHGLRIFGADQRAAMLEGSKVFAKEFMQKYGVATAAYQSFTDYNQAVNYVEQQNTYPIVIKASGLAAGKGVIIAENLKHAQQALQKIMLDKVFGDSGNEVVIEEFLEGKEISVLSVFDGKVIIPFLSAKDHKKIGEGEVGLNTGGMGVLAPVPYVTREVLRGIEENILQPTLRGLLEEGMNFAGFIFFGVMLAKGKVYLLEYNMRLGDPETQAILPLMKSDFLDILEQGMERKLGGLRVEWDKRYCCCVVLVSEGYPEDYGKGYEISGLELIDNQFCVAGAIERGGVLYSDGGRVVNILGYGESSESAIADAYRRVERVNFRGKKFRRDIGKEG